MFDEAAQSFMCFQKERKEWMPYTGLLSKLSRLFYPSYSFERAIHGSDGGERKTPKVRWERGTSFGSRIDNELQSCIQFINTRHLRLADFIRFARRPSGNVHKTKPAKGAKKKMKKLTIDYPGAIHRCTRHILSMFAHMGLHPILTQVPVACTPTGMATAIDVVALGNKGKEIWLCEIKVNFDAVYHKHTGCFMQTPFDKLYDSPANQHQLQLLAGAMMFFVTYPTLQLPVRAAVFRAYDGVKVYPLEMDRLSRSAIPMWNILSGRPATAGCTCPSPSPSTNICDICCIRIGLTTT